MGRCGLGISMSARIFYHQQLHSLPTHARYPMNATAPHDEARSRRCSI